MVARYAKEADAMTRTAAERLAEALPWTPANLRRIAAAYLADPQHGTISDDLVHAFLTQGELDERDVEPLLADLERMRVAARR